MNKLSNRNWQPVKPPAESEGGVMGGRDHSIECERCGASYGGLNGPDMCQVCSFQSVWREAASATIGALERACWPSRPWFLWPFDKAPEALRALSQNGGDEDWILVLPPGVDRPFFTDDGQAFGRCGVEEHVLPCGRRVLIGCHA